MPITLKPTLREIANFNFSRLTRKPANLELVVELATRLLQQSRGLAIFESRHGQYAYPLFMKDMMKIWAENNATRFYNEMVLTAKQPVFDEWHQNDTDNDRAAIACLDEVSAKYQGFSKRQWQHYWLMLKEAHDQKMKIVGLDKPEIRSGYGALFDAPFKTMHWESVIEKDLKTLPEGDKFIVFGGVAHGTDMGGELKGIHQRLGIPRLILDEGSYTVARMPFDKKKASFIATIPKVSHQDAFREERDVRNVPISTLRP